MTQIILDPALSSKLHQLGKVAELCDPSGKVLGKFIPRIDSSEWEIVGPESTEEELDQIEQEADYVSSEEVTEHFKRLRGS